VRIAHGGNFLGYRSLILKSRYTYPAVALEECRVCIIPKTDFFALLRNNNDFYQALMEMICREADEVETKLSDMAHKPVRSRIAEALLLLANSSTNEEHIISEKIWQISLEQLKKPPSALYLNFGMQILSALTNEKSAFLIRKC
jgi:CRP-like cAMP-binding protein